MRSSVRLMLLLAIAGIAAEYRRALPGYQFEFPKDYFNHPEFRTEWWYFTGNLRGPAGHLFGYELTFFRHGIDRGKAENVWHVDDVWFAHFAMSDISGRKFVYTERFNRWFRCEVSGGHTERVGVIENDRAMRRCRTTRR
jgi:predicted secreted hydrolase